MFEVSRQILTRVGEQLFRADGTDTESKGKQAVLIPEAADAEEKANGQMEGRYLTYDGWIRKMEREERRTAKELRT